MSERDNHERKRKRVDCQRCHRPTPTCICVALPEVSISLTRSRIIVLQHPHEKKRKNRSLPLVELCFDQKSTITSTSNEHVTSLPSPSLPDFNCIVSKRLGDQVDPGLMDIIQNPDQPFLLLYPSNDAVPLKEVLDKIRQRDNGELINDDANIDVNERQLGVNPTPTTDDKRITLFFLDATWKYAKEMLKACKSHDSWPSHAITVKLSKNDIPAAMFKPRRFDIRTPPCESHLSTAETIAHVLRIVEDNDEIFDILMKPLDLMVQQWHSFFEETTNN